MNKNLNKKGFTLIELLVVVLIIGILASIALPQYNKAVEKAHMAEALPVLRAIANAQQVFYMANGRYATAEECDGLDITISGEAGNSNRGRIKTKNFEFGCTSGDENNSIAIAQRLPLFRYHINVKQENPEKFSCGITGNATYTPNDIQKKLCEALESNGSL